MSGNRWALERYSELSEPSLNPKSSMGTKALPFRVKYAQQHIAVGKHTAEGVKPSFRDAWRLAGGGKFTTRKPGANEQGPTGKRKHRPLQSYKK